MSKNIFTFNKEKNDKTNSIFMENMKGSFKTTFINSLNKLNFVCP